MREMTSILHFSIDDFILTLKDLTEKETQYQSLFEQPLFAFLKKMHAAYGAVFSCYCFGRDINSGFRLEDVTRKYRKEFCSNADWLRFGFHGMDSGAVYGDNGGTRTMNRDAGQAAEDYGYVVKQLEQIVGEAALDEIPRVHFFAGTRECCAAWKNAEHGIKGMLAADDDRYSYYHDEGMRARLMEGDILYDGDMRLYFFRTHIRLEKEKDPELLRAKIKNFQGECQIIFTHECYLAQKEMQEKIELCGQEAVTAGRGMEFPASCMKSFDCLIE